MCKYVFENAEANEVDKQQCHSDSKWKGNVAFCLMKRYALQTLAITSTLLKSNFEIGLCS